MPPKDSQGQSELYILTPNGERIRFGKIQETQMLNDDECDITGNDTIFNPMQTATFEVSWSPTTEMIYLIIHGRFPSNNWRRMHGLPVKRKIRKRNSRNCNGQLCTDADFVQ